MAETKLTEWFTLLWDDEAGRGQQMTGPHYSLQDKVKELKNAKVPHKLEKCGWIEEAPVTSEAPSKSKQVEGKELEVRG